MKKLLLIAVVIAVLLASVVWVGGCKRSPTYGTRTGAPGARRAPAAAATPTAATIYTCPMHPEVTSQKPGECPKCGMALVPKQK